jgi:hypothetical protein
MCNIPTFNGEMPSVNELVATGRSVGTQTMHKIQGEALNPALKNCGILPECRGCNIMLGVQVREVGRRVAAKLK